MNRSRVPGLRRAPLVTVIAGWLAASIVGACAGPTASRPATEVDDARGDVALATPAPTTAPTPAPTTAPTRSLTPAPTVEPTPAPTAAPTVAPVATPAPEPFALNLYRKGDYVAQYTFEWCVGASLQMALNMVGRRNDTSRARQQDLWEMARDRSSSPFGGANPRGWTASLNDLGIGPYRLVSLRTYEEALMVAARAIRTTERPVGLVMWRGRHAWVMSGFESVGDPAVHESFQVTGIRVLDPLYPHGSAVWGPSPRPNALVSPNTLAKQFVIRDRGRVDLGVPPGWLLILPVSEA